MNLQQRAHVLVESTYKSMNFGTLKILPKELQILISELLELVRDMAQEIER